MTQERGSHGPQRELKPAPAGGPALSPEKPVFSGKLSGILKAMRPHFGRPIQKPEITSNTVANEPVVTSAPTVDRRGFLKIAAGAGAALGVAAGGGTAAYLALNAEGKPKKASNPTPEGTKPAVGTTTQTTEATQTASPDTQTATPTTPPTETATPEPEGSRGNVASVEALNILDSQKEAINKMLENATAMTIVERDGQVVIKAIDNSMLARTEPYDMKDYSGTDQKCSVLKDIVFRPTEDISGIMSFPTEEAKKSFLETYDPLRQESYAVLEAKRQAWMAQTGGRLSFEEFMEARKSQNFGFARRARNAFFPERAGNVTHDDKSPVVIIFTDNPEPHTVEFTQSITLDQIEGNGVICERIWSVRPGGLGSREERYAVREDYEFDGATSYSMAQWSDKANLNIIGGGLRSGHIFGLSPSWKEIIKYSIPVQKPDHWMGISKVKGIPAVT